MNKIPIHSKFSFIDSSFKSYNLNENGELIVQMHSWEDIPFRVIFKHVIQFWYKIGDLPNAFFLIKEGDSSLELAVADYYGYIPAESPFKMYYIEDIDDDPFMKVVAEDVEIVKC